MEQTLKHVKAGTGHMISGVKAMKNSTVLTQSGQQ